MVTVGTSSDDWDLYATLSKQFSSDIFYSVGLHPSYVDCSWEIQVSKLKSYWEEGVKPKALGEVGLDYFRLPHDRTEAQKIVKLQEEALRYQLRQALELNCAIIIHSRSAFENCVKIIDQSGVDWSKVVFHCFSEGIKELKQIQSRGGWVSFTGILTFKANQSLQHVFKLSDQEKVRIETDSPYLAPVPKRGKENEPSYLPFLGAFAAEILNSSEIEFAERMMINSNNFYGC